MPDQITVELGQDYTDTVTKFTGTATARTTVLHGPVSVCLERADSDGKPEEVWLPEGRLRDADPKKKVGLG